MADSGEGVQAELRLAWDEHAPKGPPVYANYVQATFTPEDFTLHLGWYATPALKELPPDNAIEAPIQPVARVILPLNLMKNVIALLQRQVKGYEESFGPLPDHPNKPPWLQEEEAAVAGETDA